MLVCIKNFLKNMRTKATVSTMVKWELKMRDYDERIFIGYFKTYVLKSCEYIIYQKKLIFLNQKIHIKKKNFTFIKQADEKEDTHLRSGE